MNLRVSRCRRGLRYSDIHGVKMSTWRGHAAVGRTQAYAEPEQCDAAACKHGRLAGPTGGGKLLHGFAECTKLK